MSMMALDFDGTLCVHAFPEIGEVLEQHLKVHERVRKFKENGGIVILWTCRDDKEERAYLTEAVEWCKKHNIPIDYANCYPNPGWSGFEIGEIIPCRKVCADVYIDDKCLHVDHC
jgi:hypothetical protein